MLAGQGICVCVCERERGMEKYIDQLQVKKTWFNQVRPFQPSIKLTISEKPWMLVKQLNRKSQFGIARPSDIPFWDSDGLVLNDQLNSKNM